MTENELISACRKQVEEKFHLPGNGSWKQRDFQYLADLVAERSGTRLSISTLKRIWKEQDNRLPQLYTLNALVHLLDYKSWNDYKNARVQTATIEPGRNRGEQHPANKRKIAYWQVIIVLSIPTILALFYFLPRGKIIKTDGIVFNSRKNISNGVPNTVVFEYDISKTGFDSAVIQQSWDERMKAKVSKNNHFQTFIYYYPGYHTAKLIIDNKIVKEEQVNISTDGWEALVDGDVSDKIPFYLPKKDIISNGRLYVSKEMLLKNDIRANDKEFSINFFNVGKFNPVQADNFIMETRLKNNPAEGALICQYTQLNLICENGLISVPFCNPGCVSNIHLHISDIFKDGKVNDLSAFGIDLGDWRNIKIQSVNKEITVFADAKQIYKLRFNKDLGKITGFHYKFFGCGSVDDIKLWNEKKELSYGNDFSSSVLLSVPGQ
jgi:hypothetical protein